MVKYFKNYSRPEFASAGHIPNEDIVLDIGVLPFPSSMLDQLRLLGLVVEVNDTKVELRNTYTVATKNVPLTPEQAKVLVHLNRPLIDFKVALDCYWTDGKFQEL